MLLAGFRGNRGQNVQTVEDVNLDGPDVIAARLQ
jgi:hypothetical protein